MPRGTDQREGDRALIEAIRHTATRIDGGLADYDRLIEDVGDSKLVLIGDGTHGTDEFYRERAIITRRLIAERGFTAVAVEADWPDAYRVNRFVRGISSDEDSSTALSGFIRFPTWMWRNHPVVEFVDWLADYNQTHREAWNAVGFYGLDLYSLYASIDEILSFLERTDPELARRARERYECFDLAGSGDAERYGLLASYRHEAPCERAVLEQLVELQQSRSRFLAEDEVLAEDEFFFVEQNARLVKNAEEYYRTMYRGGVSSWNLRDRHMMETVDALLQHLGGHDDEAKLVLWAHNSHLGDARATSMGRAGEWNLGQLVREQFADAAYLIGFTTYEGEVTAARDWGSPADERRVLPAVPNSYEALFHQTGLERFWLPLRDPGEALGLLREERLERMIGVIYRPETERQSHYFHCELTHQFDSVVHLDVTTALEPLERTGRWQKGEPPETYPTSF